MQNIDLKLGVCPCCGNESPSPMAEDLPILGIPCAECFTVRGLITPFEKRHIELYVSNNTERSFIGSKMMINGKIFHIIYVEQDYSMLKCEDTQEMINVAIGRHDLILLHAQTY